MNHIIAALFIIGIFFGVITATNEVANLAELQAQLALLETAMAELPDTADSGALGSAIEHHAACLVSFTTRRAGASARALHLWCMRDGRGSHVAK